MAAVKQAAEVERCAAVASLHAQNAHLEVTALVYSSVRDYVPEDRALRCAKGERLMRQLKVFRA